MERLLRDKRVNYVAIAIIAVGVLVSRMLPISPVVAMGSAFLIFATLMFAHLWVTNDSIGPRFLGLMVGAMSTLFIYYATVGS